MKSEAVILRSPEEIEKLRKSNVVVAEVLAVLKEKTAPGITTMDLETIAVEETGKRGAKPAFKGYKGYPFALCTSVNEEVVHGMPSGKRTLKEGDIVGIDFGVLLDGYYGDSAVTVPVGRISQGAEKLLKVTESSLDAAIEEAREGNRINDVSYAVQRTVEAAGFSVVRAFVGHGIGTALHEPPQVPNFGVPGRGLKLKAGMVLAIEPMVNEGESGVKILSDGWTAVTADGKLSAHFEHSVAITGSGPYVLSRL